MPGASSLRGTPAPNFNELATPAVVNCLKFAAGDAAAAPFVYPPLL